jgi:hypothetical protein
VNKKHTEIKFEDALEHQLLSPEGGFWQGNAAQFDKSRAIVDPKFRTIVEAIACQEKGFNHERE